MTAPVRGDRKTVDHKTADPTIVEVKLGARSYDIVIGRGVIASLGARIAALRPGAKTFIVTDENVARHVLPAVETVLGRAGIKQDSVVVPPGESSKSFRVFEQVCEAIIASRIERGDLVVALGGGVIGDLAGFAAAVVRRGLDYVQVPTTLLAQVDSSVGGKTAINSSHGKNLIGAFHQPILVVADTALLDTLPAREFRAGYAELVKYGLLGDAAFFAWLEANWNEVFAGGILPAARDHAIAESCRAKAAIVARDERETGDRQLLNLGHTFGHALEAACGYSDRLLHGEAIAIGMALAFDFSAARQGLVSKAEAARAIRHLAAVGLPTRIRNIPGPLPSVDQLMELIAQDKKIKRGKLTFILVRGIGAAFIETGVDEAEVRAFLEREACRAMTIIDWLTVAAILICLLVSAFFSASETALTASSRAAMMRLEKQGSRDAGIVNRLLATRERLLGAILLGNNSDQYRRLDVGDRPASRVLRQGRRDLRHAGDDGADLRRSAKCCRRPPPSTARTAWRWRWRSRSTAWCDWFLPILKAVEWLVRLILRAVGMPVGKLQIDPLAARGIARRRRSPASRRRSWKSSTAT